MRTRLVVRVLEIATGDERDPHYRQVAWRHDHKRRRPILGGTRRISLDVNDARERAQQPERRRAHECGFDYIRR